MTIFWGAFDVSPSLGIAVHLYRLLIVFFAIIGMVMSSSDVYLW